MLALLLSIWVTIWWTNPPQPIDTLRLFQVKAPHDTIPITMYSSKSPLVVKTTGGSNLPDSGFISISTANIVGPAALRIIIKAHNGAGWNSPSNAVSLFYAAKDTLYYGPDGTLPAPGWSTGIGLHKFVQDLGDTTWVSWQHCEVYQNSVRDQLCRIYGYVCRRGVRDTVWCNQP